MPCDPFLFFHSDGPVEVSVRAGCWRGIPIASWPAGEPQGRSMVFEKVLVDPAAEKPAASGLRTEKFPGLTPLANFRAVGATPVRVGKAVEGGLAYESAMPFPLALSVKRDHEGMIVVRNDSDIVLQGVLLIPAEETSRALRLGTLGAREVRRVATRPSDKDLCPLAETLDLELGTTGLFPEEIRAMRRTLLTADFTSGLGVRLVARIPDAVWRTMFPLEVKPAPRQLLRLGMLRVFDSERYAPGTDQEIPLPGEASGK